MRKIVFAVISILLIFIFLFYFELPLNILRPVFHGDTIVRYSQKYNFDPLLITAIIKVESNFVRSAKSHRGAVGLMQILPSTAKELAVELGYKNFKDSDLKDPEINIHLGTYYLYKLHKEFKGNLILSLASYNAGKSKVQQWQSENPLLDITPSDIPYEETRNYVKNISRTYEWLQKTRNLKSKVQLKKPQQRP